MTHDDPRDAALAAALRELPVPDHRAGFFDDVHAQLLAEDGSGPLRDRATRGPRLVDHGAGPRTSRRRWRRQALRAVVVSAAAAVIGVAVGVNLDRSGVGPGDGGDPPVVALPRTAVQVAQKVQAAVSSVETLRGELVFRDVDGEVRSRFVVTDAGDFRMTGITRQEDLAYDAETGVERSYFHDPDPSSPDFGGERRGIAPGPPDEGPAVWLLQRELGSTVRAILADDAEMSVAETTHEGRDAWVLDLDVEPNHIGGGGDHLTITVDQETGFPVRVVETAGGEFFREVRLDKLIVDTPVERSEFTLEFPPGIEVTRSDAGWRRHESLAEAAGSVPYAPLVPATTALPDGYRLAQISTVGRAQGTGVEGLNPATREAVSLAFHRGLDRIIVTTRLRGEVIAGREPGDGPGECAECLGDSSWSDPLASGEGFVDDPEELVVDDGALAGAPAQLLIGPRTVPHVWALSDSLVVTVSGDATRAELLEILNALEPHAG